MFRFPTNSVCTGCDSSFLASTQFPHILRDEIPGSIAHTRLDHLLVIVLYVVGDPIAGVVVYADKSRRGVYGRTGE